MKSAPHLPWKLVLIEGDGRCALHAAAVACGKFVKGEVIQNSAHLIKRDVLEFYDNTPAHKMIEQLFHDGEYRRLYHYKGFTHAHVANPLEFRDFIYSKSPWASRIIIITEQLDFSSRLTIPHYLLVQHIHNTKQDANTTKSVLQRKAIIFVHRNAHWSVLLPYEFSMPLPHASAEID
jgi:hypothetical protein